VVDIIHLTDPDVDGGVLLKWALMKECEDLDWIQLIHDRDQWRALNTVMNFRDS